MSEQQHTPAPWVFDGDWRRIPTVFGPGGQIVASVEKHKRMAVNPGPQGDLPEREANARLIIAAPALLEAAQLLEAAEHARQDCEECEGEDEPEKCSVCFPAFDDARIKRRLAIAKAVGKP